MFSSLLSVCVCVRARAGACVFLLPSVLISSERHIAPDSLSPPRVSLHFTSSFSTTQSFIIVYDSITFSVGLLLLSFVLTKWPTLKCPSLTHANTHTHTRLLHCPLCFIIDWTSSPLLLKLHVSENVKNDPIQNFMKSYI